MSHTEEKQQELSLGKAIFGFVIPFGIVLVMVLSGIDVLAALLVATFSLLIYGLVIGFKWDYLEKSFTEGAAGMLGSMFVMLLVGIMIAVWIASGSVPALLYYGLKIINPQFFLPLAFLICVITSIATGTCWGTAGTMGIALMGVAAGMGIPLPLAAGAIISGAHVGDKLSPLSDTTLLASASTGTKLFDHITSMLYTTVPISIACIIIYAVMGMKYGGSAFDTTQIQELTQGLADNFNINILMLVPPVLVIVLSVLHFPSFASFGIGIGVSIIWAMLFQHVNIGDLLSTALYGYEAQTGMESLDSLLSRGGALSMDYTIFVTIVAGMFTGLSKGMGTLSTIMKAIRTKVHTPGGLITLTTVTCIAMQASSDQYCTLTIPGAAFKETYEEMDINSCVLSRTMEDTGTLIGSIIPWDVSAIFFAGTLGVSTLEYIPYTFLLQ